MVPSTSCHIIILMLPVMFCLDFILGYLQLWLFLGSVDCGLRMQVMVSVVPMTSIVDVRSDSVASA